MKNTWEFRENVRQPDVDLGGFDVEATDGDIGKVDDKAVRADYVIVDTGFWIFGKKRLVPAGVIERIDYDSKTVYLTLTKDQVKAAPDLDEEADRSADEWSRESYGTYYDPYSW